MITALLQSLAHLQTVEPQKLRPVLLLLQPHMQAADDIASHMQILQVGQGALQDCNLQQEQGYQQHCGTACVDNM
jgi:hypothetical protein